MILLFLGISMTVPMTVDLIDGNPDWKVFLECGALTGMTGVFIGIACHGSLGGGFSTRQAYLMTVGAWFGSAAFCAIPFMLGSPALDFTDALFEATSGITTTGSSVIPHLENLPPGILLWRGMLNWYGGLGIAFVAMIFFPFLRVGGMRFFQIEGFDTLGKVLPHATNIARWLIVVYVGITVVAASTYGLFGMTPLDAVVNAMATVATGGFSTADASFGKYHGPVEYAGAFFMIVSSMPYIRFVQLLRGNPGPLRGDHQIRGYLVVVAVAVGVVVLWRLWRTGGAFEPILRGTLFNLASIISGTGFSTDNVAAWGSFAMVVALIIGFIGGCTSSSSGAITVFRWQIFATTVSSILKRIRHPHRVATPRYEGRTVSQEVLNTTMFFITLYFITVGIGTVSLNLAGIDPASALFAVWTSIGNIGYGFGDALARTGTFVDFPMSSKWVLISIMLLGRLGFVPIIILFIPEFWTG